ncbi:UNVERIFIED_CONTAM: hypothetical protein PYX00_001280 [Menopon gallinae]|uniref:MOG interacting and ectopic P-granules protein 1 n=1 Tax=Menopon gallinae TaxID=328185 RepID=A0AAW2ID06_9NEOP
METMTTECSNSSDTLKDFEKTKIKLNGEMNGSMEIMEVDMDSHDSDYKKEAKDTYSGDGSNDGSSRVNNGGDASSDSDEHSGEEDSQDIDSSSSKLKHSENSNSHQGFHESMEVDCDSINSGEVNLTNSDIESEQTSRSKDKGDYDKEILAESDEEDDDDDEEGDISRENNQKSVDDKDIVDLDSDDPSEGSKVVKDGENKKSNGECASGGHAQGIQSNTQGSTDKETTTTTTTKKSNEPQVTITPRRSSRTVQKPVRFGHDTPNPHDPDGEEDDLEGRGAVPMAQSSSQSHLPAVTVTPQPQIQPPSQSSSVSQQSTQIKTYPGLPAALPAQGLYPPKPVQRPPPILPTLTDDMYVVEAPSFIVPYVYEKPPVKKFKKYLKKMLKQIKKDEESSKKVQVQAETVAKDAAGEKKDDAAKPAPGNEKGTQESGKKDDAEGKQNDKAVGAELKDVAEKKGICDSIEDSIKVNEIKKEDDGDVSVKELNPTKKGRKENKRDAETSSSDEEEEEEEEEKRKPSGGTSYFDNPLGKFFMQIGMNLVQEFVQTDLLKQQKKKQKLGKGNEDTQQAIISLKKNLQLSKENNEPYAMEQNKCDYCSFKTESKLIMAHHLETPHMRNYVYRCNFCPLEVRGPHDILFHMEAEHNIRGRLERAPAFHQCPQCPFEDNQKGKLTRHLLTCAKKFRPEKNLEPPLDWEPPAKIPRMTRKPPNMSMNVNNPLYQQALASKNIQHPLLPKMVSALNNQQNALMRARGRPNFPQVPPGPNPKMMPQRPLLPQLTRANMVYRPGNNAGSQQVLVPTSYQLSGSQIFQKNPAAVKLLHQPSISITPLPRQSSNNSSMNSSNTAQRQAGAGGGSKTTFVICEICDGYIKDLEQLRNHMQWIHKVKIHPKMIYNRPPLNCQKCQFRFFTDQGLERHLLGSHGLVTSSMQDSANKGKDGGRCPVCGRVYQWKLLNHVGREHNMTLKPAHLSYKCTVCTATFGMYKQFENHVYSAHSVVAKRVMDKKNGQSSSSTVTRPDAATLLKPLKINDEITIIPQPAKKPSSQNQARPVPGTSRVSIQRILQSSSNKSHTDSVQVIDLEDTPLKSSGNSENGGVESLTAVKERLRRRKSLEIRQVDSEPDPSEGESEDYESTSRSKVNSANEDEDEEMPQEDDRKGTQEEEEVEDDDDEQEKMDQDGEESEG